MLRGKLFIVLGFLLGLVYSINELKNAVPMFKAEAVISISDSNSGRTVNSDQGLLSFFGDNFSSFVTPFTWVMENTYLLFMPAFL